MQTTQDSMLYTFRWQGMVAMITRCLEDIRDIMYTLATREVQLATTVTGHAFEGGLQHGARLVLTFTASETFPSRSSNSSESREWNCPMCHLLITELKVRIESDVA